MKLETKQQIRSIINRVLDNISNPVMDDIVYYVSQNNTEEATRILLEQEGHWLSKEEAELFVTEVRMSFLRVKLKKSIKWIVVGLAFVVLFLWGLNTMGFERTLAVFIAAGMTTALLHLLIELIHR